MGIVVLGAVFIDIKGHSTASYIPAGRNVGTVEEVHGGVSRNVVEDIANVSIDGKYEIFNLAGVKVASGDTENGTIDMTSLIAGRYILMLTSGNDVYRSIIIKK